MLEEMQKARKALENARKSAEKKGGKQDSWRRNGVSGCPPFVPPVSGPYYSGTPGYNGAQNRGDTYADPGTQRTIPNGQSGTRTCPRCGKTHPDFVSVCTCGTLLI